METESNVFAFEQYPLAYDGSENGGYYLISSVGNPYLGGSFPRDPIDQSWLQVNKYSHDLDDIWTRTYDIDGYFFEATGSEITSDGGVIAYGRYGLESVGVQNRYILIVL